MTAAERVSLFASWGYQHFRFLWVSLFVTSIARWMDILVVAWLLLDLTDSPLLVGLAGACRGAGMLAGPFCGVLADRFNRRTILIVAQAVWAVSALLIMMMFLISRLEVWQLFVYVFVGGVSYAFDWSIWFVLAGDIVKSRHLTNAISLLVVTGTFASGVGPLLGGGLLELIHASGAFALLSSSLLLGLLMLLLIRIDFGVEPDRHEPPWRNLVHGFRYVASDRALLALILIATLINFLLSPVKQTILPVFARDVLHIGASGLGQLMGLIALGGLGGGLIAANLERFRNKGRLFIAGVMAWPIAYLVFATSGWFGGSVLALLVAGAAEGLTFALLQALLMRQSLPEMRGRVSGLRAFAISPNILGSSLAGAAIGPWGATATLAAAAFVFATACVIILGWAAREWELR